MSFKIIGTPLLGSLQSIPRPSILYLFYMNPLNLAIKKPDMRYISGLINQLLKQVMPVFEQ